MARQKVSDAAERTLEVWLDQVAKGQLHIAELPLCVSAWFFAGYADGRASRQHEIDRLEHQLDGLWTRAFLKADERRERILQRLDQGLSNATEEQWQQIEHDLAVAAGRIPNIVQDEQSAIERTPDGRTGREAAEAHPSQRNQSPQGPLPRH